MLFYGKADQLFSNELRKGFSCQRIIVTSDVYLDENHRHSRNYNKVRTRKRVLRRKIHEHVHSFSLHGLTRIIIGNKLEKCIWTLILVAALFGLAFVTNIYVEKFLTFNVYTEVHSVITDKAHLPAITFCLSDFLKMYKGLYCGHQTFSAAACPNDHPKGYTLLPHSNHRQSDDIWSNGVFHFTYCHANEICTSSKHIKSSMSNNGACVTWNHNGSLFQDYNHVAIDFEIDKKVFENFDHQPLVDVIAHSHDVVPGELLNPQMIITPGQRYHLQLRKSQIKRLPAPYPSNCTNHYFLDLPGRYNRQICTILDFDVKTFQKCGDVRDFKLPYIPDEIKQKYNRTVKFPEIYECFMQQDIKQNNADCPLPCLETNYDLYGFTYPLPNHQLNEDPRRFVYSLNVGYQTVDYYQVMEERALYTWDRLASEFGGLCGLFVGASILSIVEIISYFILVILYKLS